MPQMGIDYETEAKAKEVPQSLVSNQIDTNRVLNLLRNSKV